MSKVTKEVAEAEVNQWLEKKKILKATIESLKDSIDVLIASVEEGVLILDTETYKWKHELLFPLEGEKGVTSINELTYIPRLNDKILRQYSKGVKGDDSEGRLNAYIAALTGQPREVIASLDSTDKKISMAIAIFFL